MSNNQPGIKIDDAKTMEDLFKDLFLKKYTNMPTDMNAAVERIRELELVLEDLARAVEIATITGSHTLCEGFVERANRALETKMLDDHSGPEVALAGPGETVEVTVGVDKDGNLGTETRRS